MHEESKDVQALARLGLIKGDGIATNTISAPKDACIGNKTWGRIDFLVNHRGWHFVWTAPKNVQSENVKKNKRRKKNIYESEDD